MDAAHTNKHLLSDYVYGIPLLIGILINYFWPHSFGEFHSPAIWIIAGTLCLLFALYLILAAKAVFRKFNQPSEPQKATTRLVTSGVYKVFRNPQYLSLTFLLLGISLCFDIPVLILLDLMAVIITHHFFILPEEKYLSQKFGKAFQDYKAKSRRWL